MGRVFSDDVSVTVFLPMIEKDLRPAFKHLQNWNNLSSQEKADLVINNMIKLICVADFSSHYFEEVLNKDSRLDINAPKEE